MKRSDLTILRRIAIPAAIVTGLYLLVSTSRMPGAPRPGARPPPAHPPPHRHSRRHRDGAVSACEYVEDARRADAGGAGVCPVRVRVPFRRPDRPRLLRDG